MNTNENRDGMKAGSKEVLRYYGKHWKALLVSAVVFLAAALLAMSFFVTPQYEANLTVYVSSTKSSQPMDAVTDATQQLVNTCRNLIESTAALEQVIETAELDYTVQQLREAVTANQLDNTGLFTVAVSDADPRMAAYIANTIAHVAPKMISQVVEGSSVKIIDYAVIPEQPVSLSWAKKTVVAGLAALAGLLLSALVLALCYIFGMRLRTEKDLERCFGAPVLGCIPDFNQDAAKSGQGKDAAPVNKA